MGTTWTSLAIKRQFLDSGLDSREPVSPKHGAHDLIHCATIDTPVRELPEFVAGVFRTREVCTVRRALMEEWIARRSLPGFRQGVDIQQLSRGHGRLQPWLLV